MRPTDYPGTTPPTHIEPPEIRLAIESLTVSYGPIRAVRDLSVEVPASKCVLVTGANGAGKSTLLRTVAGLVQSAAGAIRLDGDDITRLPCQRRLARGLFLVPEGRGVLRSLTVDDNLLLACRGRGRGRRRAADAAYDQIPALAAHRKRRAGALSGGQLQLLALGRAVVAAPSLLLLDEPSMGLSPRAIREVSRVVADLKRAGMTILLVEQRSSLAAGIADKVYHLDHGEVAWQGDWAGYLKTNLSRALTVAR